MTTVAILGGSGYGGGELLRILTGHPEVEVVGISSRRLAGRSVGRAHPNLRGVVDLRFCAPDDLPEADILFLALPHGEAARRWDDLSSRAGRFIDLSADFRLDSEDLHASYYGEHPRPDLLGDFVYGLAELNRETIRSATRVSTGGCNATVSILALLPLYEAGVVERDRTVIDIKVGSSEGGATSNEGSHHPVRSGVVRPYAATGHRHAAEIESALMPWGPARVHMSVSAIDMVRGAAALSHVFLSETLTERDVWKILRGRYGDEPFIRLVAERSGSYRLPEPKLLAGTNYCDIGFELDDAGERLVMVSAIDNLVKGSAGQAVQALNLMMGWDERAGLSFPGLHPV